MDERERERERPERHIRRESDQINKRVVLFTFLVLWKKKQLRDCGRLLCINIRHIYASKDDHMNTESSAALEDEVCYLQQAKSLEPIKSMNWNAANLVITQDAGKQNKWTISQDVCFRLVMLFFSVISSKPSIWNDFHFTSLTTFLNTVKMWEEVRQQILVYNNFQNRSNVGKKGKPKAFGVVQLSHF